MTRVLSDDRLARRAARGEDRAFATIFDRYHQRLYRYCLAIVGDPEDAQDTLQNTMVRVLRGLPGEERRIELPWLQYVTAMARAANDDKLTARGASDRPRSGTPPPREVPAAVAPA
jgi:DNA-directed RNA polymerase specialized sigma24 family protein